MRSLACVLFLLLAAVLTFGIGWHVQADDKDKPPLIRRPAKADKDAPPPEDKLFVWQLPDEGDQSVMILKVIDADTVDVALLHPIRVRLRPGAKKWKVEDLDKEIAGKLLQMRIGSRDEATDRSTVSIWLGTREGWLHEKK